MTAMETETHKPKPNAGATEKAGRKPGSTARAADSAEIKPLSIVIPTAGRDTGALFAVIRVESDCAYIADGKGRRTEKPKKKKLKHLRLAEGSFGSAEDGETASPRETGAALTNADVRKLLAAFVPERDGDGENAM